MKLKTMKLNPEIYRKAARLAWESSRKLYEWDHYNGYCCNAIEVSLGVWTPPKLLGSYLGRFERTFYPKKNEVDTEIWKQIDSCGYWGYVTKKNAEERVLALLLLAEMVESENEENPKLN